MLIYVGYNSTDYINNIERANALTPIGESLTVGRVAWTHLVCSHADKPIGSSSDVTIVPIFCEILLQ